MNVRIDKPIRKGESRHGVLSREANGVVCFDETDQRWLNNPVRATVRLRKFERYGTRVSRKGQTLIIRQEVSLSALAADDFMGALQRANELTDAVAYCQKYAHRRR